MWRADFSTSNSDCMNVYSLSPTNVFYGSQKSCNKFKTHQLHIKLKMLSESSASKAIFTFPTKATDLFFCTRLQTAT